MGGDVALKVLVHYYQLYKSGQFAYYDYGKSGNLIQYGQETAPSYKIGNIKAPMAIFYAPHDRLVSPKDVLYFVKQLTNVIFLKQMSYQHYSHFDFLWSKTVNEDVYNRVFEFIKQH